MLTFKVNLGKIVLSNKFESDDRMSMLTKNLFDGDGFKEKAVHVIFRSTQKTIGPPVECLDVYVGDQQIDLFQLLEFEFYRIYMPNYFGVSIRRDFEARSFSFCEFTDFEINGIRKKMRELLLAQASENFLKLQCGLEISFEDDVSAIVFTPKNIYAASFIFMSLRGLARHWMDCSSNNAQTLNLENYSKLMICETQSYLTRLIFENNNCHGNCHASKSWC